MIIDDQIRDEKHDINNMILTEKLSKYHSYHQEKLTSMNILQAKIYHHLIKNK